MLAQKGLLIHRSGLDVIDPFVERQLRMGAGVQQRSVLRDRLTLDGAKIGERIVTRIVVVPVPSHETADVEDRVRIDDAGVGRGDVVGADLGALIGIPDIVEHRAGAGSPAHHIRDIELVIVIRTLEPGARVVEVDMNRIGGRELIIHAVKDVLFIALGVEDLRIPEDRENGRCSGRRVRRNCPSSGRRSRDRLSRSRVPNEL